MSIQWTSHLMHYLRVIGISYVHNVQNLVRDILNLSTQGTGYVHYIWAKTIHFKIQHFCQISFESDNF